ncbi:MAG TPA: response regulator [Opitutaceae bacterium]|nr:response regulator [Opitutaceae bacterium]
MKTIRTMIVDDEPLAREGIALMLADDPDIEIVAQCGDGEEALAQVMEHRPDLAFLDIQMPRLNGLEVLDRLPPERRPVVVFVTAHDQYAVGAFERSASGYVLKPFQDERFRSTVSRAKEQVRRADLGEMLRRTESVLEKMLQAKAPPGPEREPEPRRRLTFKSAGSYVVAPHDEIAWIEAQGNQVKICANGKTHLVRETLDQTERRLAGGQFLRVHRSYIVNTDHIREIIPLLYGDHTVVMDDGAKIRLSRSYRHQLKGLLPPRGQ